MSHPDPIEIHDHVYGFRASSHVPGCPDCAAAAERLETERHGLRDALAAEAVEPPADVLRARSRTTPWAHLAAAAGLLAGLIWLLIPPTPAVVPGAPQADEEIARLIAELKGPAPLRREIALLGLKAYGAQAHAPLVAAGVDPNVTEAFQTPSADDVEKEQVLDRIKKDWAYDNVEARKILDAIVAETRLPATISEEAREALAGRAVTFRVKDLLLKNSLKLFLSQFNLDYGVLDGRLRIGRPRSFMTSRLPIRFGGPDPAADALVRSLGAGDFDIRGKVIDDLRRLDFAAETALWAGLDAPDPEAAGRAADLLRALYTPKPAGGPRMPETPKVLLGRRVNAAFDNASLLEAVDKVRELSELNIHISGVDNPSSYRLTFRGELPAYALFRLTLDPHGLGAYARDGVLLISPFQGEPDAAVEAGPFWADPETARGIQRLLDTPDGPVPPELAPNAFGPLRYASRHLPEPARGRARARLIGLYKSLDLRLADDPTASYLASLSLQAQAILDRKIAVDIQNETLPGLLRRYGIASRSDQPDVRPFSFKVDDVSVRAILDALTRNSDLDWRMEGEIVVFDTLANTRSAVER